MTRDDNAETPGCREFTFLQLERWAAAAAPTALLHGGVGHHHQAAVAAADNVTGSSRGGSVSTVMCCSHRFPRVPGEIINASYLYLMRSRHGFYTYQACLPRMPIR